MSARRRWLQSFALPLDRCLHHGFTQPRGIIKAGLSTGIPMAVYLWTNAALYLLLAIYCTLRADAAARALGYSSLNASGQSEYLVIYGGLQLGLALFFGVLAREQGWHRLGILFALCLYLPIVLFRVASVIRYWPVQNLTLGVAGLEIVLLLVAAALWWSQQ